MARPREFDEEEILDKAMMCFWQHGYESASIADLEKATGISRISLYNAFKDKEGLFIAVQNRYQTMSQNYIGSILQEPRIEPLIEFFEFIGSKEAGDPTVNMGCMMVNTVLDVHNIGEAVLDNVKSYRKMIAENYEDYISRCMDAGVMRKNIDPKKCAAFLLASMWGAMALTRLYQSTEHTKPHTDIVIETVKSWENQ